MAERTDWTGMSRGGDPPTADAVSRRENKGRAPLNLRRVGLAIGVGLLLYALLYGFAEYLVHTYGHRNPFYQVATSQLEAPAVVVLGASRALPLEYDDMNSRMQERLGSPVLTLASQGSGIVPNRVLLNYFLREHGPEMAGLVVYVLDSFAFQSPQWNEERLQDAELWQRAPLDPQLVTTLWQAGYRHDLPWSIFWNYLSAFSKLNDPATWFEPDLWPDEANFDRVYSANSLQDQSRIAFLYPEEPEAEVVANYEKHFGEMATELRALRVPLVVVAPPLRKEFVQLIPGEEEFRVEVQARLEELRVPFYDVSSTSYDDSLFLDPDHLNREGALQFLEELAPIVEERLAD